MSSLPYSSASYKSGRHCGGTRRLHGSEEVAVKLHFWSVCCCSPVARTPIAENTSKLMNQVFTYQNGLLP